MQGLSQYKCDKSVLSPVYRDWRSKWEKTFLNLSVIEKQVQVVSSTSNT